MFYFIDMSALHFILSYPTSPSTTLTYPILLYPILSYPIPFHFFCTILCYHSPFCSLQFKQSNHWLVTYDEEMERLDTFLSNFWPWVRKNYGKCTCNSKVGQTWCHGKDTCGDRRRLVGGQGKSMTSNTMSLQFHDTQCHISVLRQEKGQCWKSHQVINNNSSTKAKVSWFCNKW